MRYSVPKGSEARNTTKVLRSMALKIPIVTSEWIGVCQDAGRRVDHRPYIVWPAEAFPDVAPFLRKYRLCVTQAWRDSNGDTFDAFQSIISLLGLGKILSCGRGKLMCREPHIILGLPEGDDDAEELSRRGNKIYTKELLWSALRTGTLDLEADRFCALPRTV